MIVALPVVLLIMFIISAVMKARKYPYKAYITYETGSQLNNRPIPRSYWDKIGYVDLKDAEGKKTGAKVWQLASNKKQVLEFDVSYLGEVQEPLHPLIPLLKKKIPIAYVYAVMGKDGEEFRPIRMEISKDKFNYVPVFEGNRAAGLLKIYDDLIKRNTYQNWLQKNLFEIIKLGMEFLIVIMLLITVIKIGDIATAMMQSNNLMAQALNNLAIIQSQNNTNTTGGITHIVGNVSGIPFAGLPSGG